MNAPWTPDDDEARRLLNERIESFDVDPDTTTLWERFIRWLNDALALDVDPTGAGGVILQILLVAAVGVLIFLLIRYFRPSVSPEATTDEAQLVDLAVPAEQYFNTAQQYLASGHYDQAYIHAYRSMVRTAQQRRLVEVTPATTATTFGWSLAAVLPDYHQNINDASTEFNQIVYGGSQPTHASAQTMVQLAQAVEAAQPRPPAHPHHDPTRMIPR